MSTIEAISLIADVLVISLVYMGLERKYENVKKPHS